MKKIIEKEWLLQSDMSLFFNKKVVEMGQFMDKLGFRVNRKPPDKLIEKGLAKVVSEEINSCQIQVNYWHQDILWQIAKKVNKSKSELLINYLLNDKIIDHALQETRGGTLGLYGGLIKTIIIKYPLLMPNLEKYMLLYEKYKDSDKFENGMILISILQKEILKESPNIKNNQLKIKRKIL